MGRSVPLLLFFLTCVGGITFRVTPTNTHACQLKEAPDQIVPRVRSKVECAVRCSRNGNGSQCRRMSYRPVLQVCYLYGNRVPVRFTTTVVESLVTYAVQAEKEICPDGFTFIPEVPTCLRVIESKVDWIEDPRSPWCFNDKVDDARIWVSGQRLVPSSLTRYVWKPNPGKVIEFTAEAGNLWCAGEPNVVDSVESCVHLWLNYCLNDVQCGMPMCPMCQAEAQI